MPVARGRLAPPVQDAPMRPEGDQFSQAWTEHNQSMVDRVNDLLFGVTDGSEAGTGMVGEELRGDAANVALTSGVGLSICSIPLPPGDWMVSAHLFFLPDPGTDPAQFSTSISEVDGGEGPFLSLIQSPSFTVGGHAGQWVGPQRYNVTAETTVYLVAKCTFTGGAMAVNGIMWAYRWR